MSAVPMAKELADRINNALGIIDEAADLPNLYPLDGLVRTLRRILTGGITFSPVPVIAFGDLIRVKNGPNAVYRVEGLQMWGNEGEIRVKAVAGA